MKIDEFRDFIESLPNNAGILGRRKYFHSVVLVPFLEIDGEMHLLFQKRAALIRQGGEISFPGGGFDPNLDDTIEQTARRETIEELRLDSNSIHILKQFHTVVNPLGNVIDVFLGKLDISNSDDINPNKDEVEKVFTVPLSYFKETPPQFYHLKIEVKSKVIDENGEEQILFPAQDLNIPEKYHDTWSGRKISVYCWQVAGETIWGITAEIIYELTKI